MVFEISAVGQAGAKTLSSVVKDEWLVEIKPEADARDVGAAWLRLVDGLVYAGNKTLAPFSR
jgi:hypothetical protein